MFHLSPRGLSLRQTSEVWRSYRDGDSMCENIARLTKMPGAVNGVILLEIGTSGQLERALISGAVAAYDACRTTGLLGHAASMCARSHSATAWTCNRFSSARPSPYRMWLGVRYSHQASAGLFSGSVRAATIALRALRCSGNTPSITSSISPGCRRSK